MPTLSVVIPHFNDPAGLDLSLRSVAGQTWRGAFEVVIYDDGSTPTNVAAIEKILEASTLPVRLLRGEANRGRPHARNALLDAAAGEYLAWLDAGDEWSPTKLADQFQHLAARRPAHPTWVTSNLTWQRQGRAPYTRRQKVQGDQIRNLIDGSLGAYLWTLLGTTQSFRAVGHFDPRLTRVQDLDFFIRFCDEGGVLELPSELSLCTYHKSDLGRDGAEVLKCFQLIEQKHAAHYRRMPIAFRRARRGDMWRLAARFQYNNANYKAAAYSLFRSLLASPLRSGRRIVKGRF